MNTATIVTATFDQQSFILAVNKGGTGSGTVTSKSGGDQLRSHLLAPYNSGTVVTLTAAPAGGSTFSGWSGGGCSGTGSCVVTMNAATTVAATFRPAADLHPYREQAGRGQRDRDLESGGNQLRGHLLRSLQQRHGGHATAASAGGSTFSGWNGGGCSVRAPAW